MKHTYQQPTISVITTVTEYHLLDGSQERKGDPTTGSSTNWGHAESNSAGIWETDEENNETIWGTKQEW